MSEWIYAVKVMPCPSHNSRSILPGRVQGEWLSASVCVFAFMCLCMCQWKAWSKCLQGGVKLMKRGASDAPGPGLSARLMEGATLGCPLTDRCQQRPSSSEHQVGGVSSLTARKEDDTEIVQSANADTHGACTTLWTCHSVKSVCCEMRWALKVSWLIKHGQEGEVAALNLKLPLSVPFSRWLADLGSLLTLLQDRS